MCHSFWKATAAVVKIIQHSFFVSTLIPKFNSHFLPCASRQGNVIIRAFGYLTYSSQLDSTQFDSTIHLAYISRAHIHLPSAPSLALVRALYLLGGNLVTISISVLNSFHSVVCLNMVIHFFWDNIIGIWIRLFNADTLLTDEKKKESWLYEYK